MSGGTEYNGWALNISRGGIRVVIEERVELGQEFEIRELDPDIADGGPFHGRVVWVQDEPDGSVVGMEFVGPELPKFGEKAALSTSHPPSSGAPAPSSTAPAPAQSASVVGAAGKSPSSTTLEVAVPSQVTITTAPEAEQPSGEKKS